MEYQDPVAEKHRNGSSASLSRSESLKETKKSSTAKESPPRLNLLGTPKKSFKKQDSRSRHESESLPNSVHSTPKRRIHCNSSIREVVRPHRDTPCRSPTELGLNILGSPAPRRTERAHSLPGVSAIRRSSLEAQQHRRRRERASRSSLGGKEPLLDLALISDFENDNCRDLSTERCSACSGLTEAAPGTSAMSNRTYSIRRYSLQSSSARSQSTSQIAEESPRKQHRDRPRSRKSSLSSSRRTSSRYAELDYSSEVEVTSGQSSQEKSPGRSNCTNHKHKKRSDKSEKLPYSNRSNITSQGEWADFWSNYNSARMSSASRQKYYDECPTPYNEYKHIVAGDARNNKSEISKSLEIFGVALTTGETKEIIGCAHKLAEVLTLALERNNSKKDKSTDVITSKFEESSTPRHSKFKVQEQEIRENGLNRPTHDEDISL